jgi:hypothetical protein
MWNWLVGPLSGTNADEDQKNLDETDRKLAALNKKRLDEGFYDQATFEQAQANLAKSKIADVSGEIDQAFDQGFSEGLDNVRGTAGKALSFPFKLIPWQGYALLAVGLFVYMGGWKLLKGILKK